MDMARDLDLGTRTDRRDMRQQLGIRAEDLGTLVKERPVLLLDASLELEAEDHVARGLVGLPVLLLGPGTRVIVGLQGLLVVRRAGFLVALLVESLEFREELLALRGVLVHHDAGLVVTLIVLVLVVGEVGVRHVDGGRPAQGCHRGGELRSLGVSSHVFVSTEEVGRVPQFAHIERAIRGKLRQLSLRHLSLEFVP